MRSQTNTIIVMITNKKHQSTINKCVKAINRYYALNDLRDTADNMGYDKEFKKYDRMCQNAFDKYLDYLNELPKYIQAQIEKI